MEPNRRIINKWLNSVSEGLSSGEELLLPAKSKQDVKQQQVLFLRELRILSITDPIAASQLLIVTRFKDHRFWLVIKKVAFSPLIGFRKDKDGKVERVEITDSSERRRRLLLMAEDGFALKDIEEIEGKLSEEELGLLK